MSWRVSADEFFGGGEHAKTLVVGLARVLADEVDERTLFAALGGGELDAVAGCVRRAGRRGGRGRGSRRGHRWSEGRRTDRGRAA